MVALESRETRGPEVLDSLDSSCFCGISQNHILSVGFIFMLSVCNAQQYQVISISVPHLLTEVERALTLHKLEQPCRWNKCCQRTFLQCTDVLKWVFSFSDLTSWLRSWQV